MLPHDRRPPAHAPAHAPAPSLSALAVALVLAACGDGGAAPETATPATARSEAAANDAATGRTGRGGASIFERAPIEPRRAGARTANGRPLDVLILSIDTLRADRLSCYGNARPTSPTIDALAARGVRFASAYAPDCGTAQSHATMFTGALPAAHGVYNAPDADMRTIHPRFETFVQVAERAGYQTIVHTEGGQLQRGMGFDRGADHAAFRSKGMRRTLAEFEEVLGYTDDAAPLFAFFHTYEVHAPYLPPREYEGETFHGRFTEPGTGGSFEQRYTELVRRERRDTGSAKIFLEPYPGLEDEHVAWLSALYDEGVLFMDHLLARLLARWDQVRGLDNTLVVLVSDHGDQIGENGEFGHQRGLTPALTHIPFIVSGPGVRPGVVEGPIGLRSVAGTVLEHVGLARPAHMELSHAHLLDADDGARSLDGHAHQQVLRGKTYGVVSNTAHALGAFRDPPDGRPVLVLDEGAFRRPLKDEPLDAALTELYEVGRLRFLRDLGIGELAPAGTRSMGAGAREQLEALGYTGDR